MRAPRTPALDASAIALFAALAVGFACGPEPAVDSTASQQASTRLEFRVVFDADGVARLGEERLPKQPDALRARFIELGRPFLGHFDPSDPSTPIVSNAVLTVAADPDAAALDVLRCVGVHTRGPLWDLRFEDARGPHAVRVLRAPSVPVAGVDNCAPALAAILNGPHPFEETPAQPWTMARDFGARVGMCEYAKHEEASFDTFDALREALTRARSEGGAITVVRSFRPEERCSDVLDALERLGRLGVEEFWIE